MISEFDELAARAMALPARCRAELATRMLIQSLEEEDEETIKAAWMTEIQRRDREIRAGTSITRPANRFLREARGQLHGADAG